jgi:hypothetical protein
LVAKTSDEAIASGWTLLPNRELQCVIHLRVALSWGGLPVIELLTPTEVGAILKLSPRSVIARFAGMLGVVALPAENSRLTKRNRYRTIRVPRHVLDRFIAENTIQESTPWTIDRNKRKVRRQVQ